MTEESVRNAQRANTPHNQFNRINGIVQRRAQGAARNASNYDLDLTKDEEEILDRACGSPHRLSVQVSQKGENMQVIKFDDCEYTD